MARPTAAAGAPVRVARQACSPAIRAAREADRALHADGRQAALDVGGRGGRQHRRRRPEGDEREGDEQRDDDPGRRVDEHAHAAAGDEAHALDLGAGGARLLQEHVHAMGVRGPDERLVDAEGPLDLALEPPARDVHPRCRGEREGDVVGRHRDPHHAQRSQPPDLDVVAHAHVPGVGHAALDHDLVRAPGDVAPVDDRVAAPAGVDERHAAVLRRAVPAADADAGELEAVGARGDVGQRADDAVDLGARLGAEADDHIGQVGLARGAVEARGQPVGDSHRGARHRRGEQHAHEGQPAAPHGSRRPVDQAQDAVGGARWPPPRG